MSKKNYEALMKGEEIEPLEEVEAERFATWLGRDLKFEFYSHIANETRTPSRTQKRKNTALGVTSGVPDYLIILPKRFTGLDKNKLIFIEMKRVKTYKISPTQKLWLAALGNCDGVDSYCCLGFEKAKETVLKYSSEKAKSFLEKR